MTCGPPNFRFHQWHHLPIVLISPSSLLSSLHLLFNFSLSLCLCLSLSLMIAKWLSECCEAAMSRCAFRLLFLLHRLNSPPLLPSPLCSSLSLLPVWSLPLFPAAAHLQTILEEDLEDPVYQVTSWPIASLLLSTCCILVSLLLSVCTVGRRPLFGYSVEGVWRRNLLDHESLCVHVWGAWLAERCNFPQLLREFFAA